MEMKPREFFAAVKRRHVYKISVKPDVEWSQREVLPVHRHMEFLVFRIRQLASGSQDPYNSACCIHQRRDSRQC